jgi:hypothetical protein
MTFVEFLDTMHVRFGTPFTTDLKVIFPPPLNIVSFLKRFWPPATRAHPFPWHVHDLDAPASRRYARGARRLSLAIHPTFVQPALTA